MICRNLIHVFNKTLVLPHILKSCCRLAHSSHHVFTPGVRIRVMGVLAGWRITVHGVARRQVRAQHLKANFSTTVMLIFCRCDPAFWLFRYKDTVQNIQDDGGAMEGHAGSCLTSMVHTDEAVVAAQDGSVLLPLLLMKSERKKKKKTRDVSDKVSWDPPQFVA